MSRHASVAVVAGCLLSVAFPQTDREYYLSEGESMREMRAKYQAHISAMLKLAGFAETGIRPL